jgi:biotin carboxylase
LSEDRVLVIGTTPDYVANICQNLPGRAIFVTDPLLREKSSETYPNNKSEILCNLNNFYEALGRIKTHCLQWDIILSGITCFDCEWLELAAKVGNVLSLEYSSAQTVINCRDKRLTKEIWQKNGVRCPKFKILHSDLESMQFMADIGGPIVLKPQTGSGSELTFRCDDARQASQLFLAMRDGLELRKGLPLFSPFYSGNGRSTSQPSILAEEFVIGSEFSCDMIIDGPGIKIIRIAEKIGYNGFPFGTTLAYLIPAGLPGWLGREHLEKKLLEAAHALGVIRAICMVDFMITRDEIIFLELTPRIGGDCLPPLIEKSSGLNMLKTALDFAEGKCPIIPPESQWQNLIGLRLFSHQDGIIRSIDIGRLLSDARVLDVYLKRKVGDKIKLPPVEYDSWLLGHIIFRPNAAEELLVQCLELREKLVVDMEPYHEQKSSEPNFTNSQTARTKNSAS